VLGGRAIPATWKTAGFDASLPPICFSPLLTTSLTTIAAASEPFQLFTCQILTKCLLFQRHPLILASVIARSLADFDSDARPVILLCQYAKSLLEMGDWDTAERMSLLASLLKPLFSSGSLHNVLMRSLREEMLDLSRTHFSESDVKAALRQCLHVSVSCSDTSGFARQSISQLRTLTPLMDQVSNIFILCFANLAQIKLVANIGNTFLSPEQQLRCYEIAF